MRVGKKFNKKNKLFLKFLVYVQIKMDSSATAPQEYFLRALRMTEKSIIYNQSNPSAYRAPSLLEKE